MDSTEGKREFRRGLLHREPDGRYSVSLVGGRGSHLVAALAASNCLVVIEEDVTEVVPGARVTRAAVDARPALMAPMLHPGWPAVLTAGPVTVRPPKRSRCQGVEPLPAGQRGLVGPVGTDLEPELAGAQHPA